MNFPELQQYFSNIICNLTGFVNVWQNTVHRAQSGHLPWACLPHWCCRTVLPDDVILQYFLKKCFTKMVHCNFTCLCVGKISCHTMEKLV